MVSVQVNKAFGETGNREWKSPGAVLFLHEQYVKEMLHSLSALTDQNSFSSVLIASLWWVFEVDRFPRAVGVEAESSSRKVVMFAHQIDGVASVCMLCVGEE